MRSTEPLAGNPWPHDMVLRIEDSPHGLHDLLWVREAWGLHPEGDDLPPALVRAPARVLDAAGRPAEAPAEWSEAWGELWREHVAHLVHEVDPSLPGRLAAMPPGSDDQDALLELMTGPTWRGRFGAAAFTGGSAIASLEGWRSAAREELALRRPLAFDDTPEWKSLEALIAAWNGGGGITDLVLIPCRGAHTRRLSDSILLLTEWTRNDRARYTAALLSAA